MKALFVHDHIFKYDGNTYYSEGKLTHRTWERYLEFCDELVVVGRVNYTDKAKASEYSIASCNNVSFECVNKISIIDRVILKKIDSFLEKQISQVDYIIVRLPSFMGRRAFKIASLLGRSVLVELVGCPYDSLKTHGTLLAKVAAPFEKYQLQKIMRKSKHSIYVTEQFLQKRYPTEGTTASISNVELVPSAHNKKIFTAPKKVAFIGSLTARYKGLDDLINAIYIMNDNSVELHILGSGEQSYYRGLADKLGISKQVYFYSPLPGGDSVMKWLSTFDLYVQPSHTEGLPRALIEAMYVGLPCLGSNVGGIPELLDESELFEVKNVEQLSLLLAKFISDPLLCKQVSLKNQKKALKFEYDKLKIKRRHFLNNFFTQNDVPK